MFDNLKAWFRATWPAHAQKRVNASDFLPLLPGEVEAEINQALAANDRRRFARPDRLHPPSLVAPSLPHSINDDLHRDLPRLMAECAWRYATSPIFEGVCNTYCQDIAGPEGPTLQIESDDERFNSTVEAAWRVVMGNPDPSGRLSGVENLKMWVRLLLLAGSYLNIFRNVPRGSGQPDFGWSTIHPRRLITPLEFATDPDVAFGVRVNPNTGRPVTYYVDRPRRFGASEYSVADAQAFPAEMVQHRYFAVEPEQLTGYPMMASTLRTLDELVELDGATIEAAQSAAHHAWWLQSADPSKVLDPDPIGTTTYPVQRGAANVAPPGWAAVGMQATQPNADATNYRNVRLAEIGRPINMPLLIVLLSVNEATFSSAQFAGSLYRDGIMGVQRYVATETLNPLVDQVVADLVLMGAVRRPKVWNKAWTHNVPPHANIEKFVAALEKMVANGWISSADASAMLGYDWEKVIAKRVRVQEDCKSKGLPLPPVNAGNPPKPEPAEAEEAAPAAAAKPKPPAKTKPTTAAASTAKPRRSYAGNA